MDRLAAAQTWSILWMAGFLVLALFGPAALRAVTAALSRALFRITGGMKPFEGSAYVIDGDTIVVDGVRVRLFGIDAPELAQAGGHAARAHLIAQIGVERVLVQPLDLDRFGRTIARVRRGGLDLSRAMTRDGFARAMPYWSWAYVGAEVSARVAGRGLWAGDRLSGVGDPARHRRATSRQRR